MRRTDRLYALVEELRARTPRLVSRGELARLLEVTPRTVERDILALQVAGVPIWSQRGRGGGYAIDEKWNLPPLNFDAAEALAVIAALAAARTMPFASAGRRAERKLLAAMGSGEAARAMEIAGRLRLGAFGMPGHHAIVNAVEQAVMHRSVIRIGYRDRTGADTTRPVEAHGLQVSANGSYLLAWCRMRDAPRAFRLDRIMSVEDSGDTAPPRELETLDWIDDAALPGVASGGAMSVKPTTARRPGPPRKVDNRTGSSPAFARAVATALPDVTARTRKGVTAFAVGGRRFAAVDGDDSSLVVHLSGGEDHHFLLHAIGRDETRSRIESAWASYASKAALTAHRRRRRAWEALPAITTEDIRRIVAELPGATEGPIWGSDIGFLIGTEKKTRFAKFGPPEGSGVANLLAPDDAGTLVIFRCPQRPELLATSPDRFFTTPHYGDPDEPGGIILRLAEHRGPDHLAEIAELLEDAWREVASPELVAELDEGRTRTRRTPA